MTTEQTVHEATHLLRRTLALALDSGPWSTAGVRPPRRLRDAIDWLDPWLHNDGNTPTRSVADTAEWLIAEADAVGDQRRGELYRIAAVVIRGTKP